MDPLLSTMRPPYTTVSLVVRRSLFPPVLSRGRSHLGLHVCFPLLVCCQGGQRRTGLSPLPVVAHALAMSHPLSLRLKCPVDLLRSLLVLWEDRVMKIHRMRNRIEVISLLLTSGR